MGESRFVPLVEFDLRSDDTTAALANFFHLRMRTSMCARAAGTRARTEAPGRARSVTFSNHGCASVRRIIGGMNLRAFLRQRRQRKARKRYEREKALRASQNDEAIGKVAEGAKTLGSGLGGGL